MSPSSRQPFDYEPVTRSSRAPRLWESKAATIDDDWHTHIDAIATNSETHTVETPAQVKETSLLNASGKKRNAKSESWIKRRGHALSYAGLFLFTFVLYFRPYELLPALAAFSTMAFWTAILTFVVFIPTQLSLEGNITTRPREVYLILLLCLAAILSIPLAINPGASLDTFKDFIRPVLMFIVLINVVRTERRLKGLFFLTLAVSCVLSVGALNDYLHGNFAVEGYRVAGRIGNMFGNPNDMALHLVTMTPIAIGLLLSSRNPFGKIVYGGCAVLTVLGNVVTFSRGAFLGLLGVCLVLAWKIGRRNRMLVAAAALALAVAFFALAPGTYTSRLGSILDSSRDRVGSSSARQALLVRSIQVAMQHPLLGIGMGNFHIVSIHDQVNHNAYMQIATEMGWWALIVYVLFILTPLKRLRQIERETFTKKRAKAETKRFYYLAIGLQASIVGYMISSFFASVAYQWNVYYLVGYAICLRRLYMQRTATTSVEARSIEATDIETPAQISSVGV